MIASSFSSVVQKIARSNGQAQSVLFKPLASPIYVSGRDSGFSGTRRIFTADSGKDRQQAAGCFVLGNKRIDHLQCVFCNPLVARKHDDWRMWPEAPYLGGNLMPIHLGHVVIDDHRSQHARCRNLYALSSGGSREHAESPSLKQSPLVTQYAVIVVDTQNRFARWVIGHRLDSL
jgi:hypothetical protein